MVPRFALAVALALALLGPASAQHEGHSMAMAMPPAAAPRPFCVEKSSSKNCTGFTLPHPVVQGDLMALCRAMHFMPACSVYKACRAAAPGADDAIGPWTAKVASKPDVCRRLNLVATACRHDTGMGGMAGCRANFNDMCAAGSVVEMCEAMPGFPDLPTTKALNAAVKTLCTEKAGRPGCAPCLLSWNANKTYGDCDLLAVWGEICVAEPKLPLCTNHTTLCGGDADWFFCKPGAAAASAKGWKTLLAAAGVAPAAAANASAAAPKAMAAAGAAAAGAAAAKPAVAAAAKACPCPRMFMPVCGDDGETYNTPCEAKCAGAAVATEGPCADDAAAPAAAKVAAKPAADAAAKPDANAAAKPAAAKSAAKPDAAAAAKPAADAAAKPAAAKPAAKPDADAAAKPDADAAAKPAATAAAKPDADAAAAKPAAKPAADAAAKPAATAAAAAAKPTAALKVGSTVDEAAVQGGLLKAFARASGETA